MIYPWQADQWERLQCAANENRLPHALLLAGIAGIGKRDFAVAFTRYLLCEQPVPGDPGCTCHPCRLMAGRCHPDVQYIEPEKPGHAIKVDQIREIAHFVSQTASGHLRRVVMIAPADAMNMNAANALLKTLEEPSPHTHLMLVSDQPGKLPATVRSRCQQIYFSRPPRSAALAWMKKSIPDAGHAELLLRLAQGAPCAAVAMHQGDYQGVREHVIKQIASARDDRSGPLQAAAAIKEGDYIAFLSVMRTWLADLVKLQLGVGVDEMINVDYQPVLQGLVSETPLQQNIGMLALLQQMERAWQTGINLNKRLMIERVLIQWSRKGNETG